MRSSLESIAPFNRDPQPEHGVQAAHSAWHTHGLALLYPSQLPWHERKLVEQIAERLYGRRAG